MDVKSDTDKVCIIGAGSSGLAAAKTFAERGIPFDCLEREPDIGGLWNEDTEDRRRLRHDLSRLLAQIYRLRRLSLARGISRLSVPPRDARLFARLRDEFRHPRQDRAQHARRAGRARGRRLARPGRGRRASPLLSRPRHRQRSSRRAAHAENSRDIHRRDHALARLPQRQATRRQARCRGGRRQLRLATSSSMRRASRRRIYLSMRRGTYFVPKFVFGRPMDGIISFFEKIPMPRRLRNVLYTHWHRIMVGKNERYGLPEPEHRIMDTHPTMNTVLPQLYGHGRIAPSPRSPPSPANKVRFTDGSEVEADLVVFAHRLRGRRSRSSTTVRSSDRTGGRCSISMCFTPSSTICSPSA